MGISWYAMAPVADKYYSLTNTLVNEIWTASLPPLAERFYSTSTDRQ